MQSKMSKVILFKIGPNDYRRAMLRTCLLLLCLIAVSTAFSESSTNLPDGTKVTILQEYPTSLMVTREGEHKPFFIDKSQPMALRTRDQFWENKQQSPQGFFTMAVPTAIPSATETEIPKGFTWDKTLIIPDKFAFLDLPFIKQTNGGICTAAAAINVLSYLDPELHLKQGELFKLFNDRPGGASDQEVARGIMTLGFISRLLPTHALPWRELTREVQKSLDQNLPILAADRIHMICIIGYNAQTKKIFAWNQWKNGKIVNGMPKGSYEVQESDLPIEFKQLIFVKRVRFDPPESDRKQIEAILGKTDDLEIHPFFKQYPNESFGSYLHYAGPQRLKVALRSGRTVLILQGESLLCIKPQEVKNDTDMISGVTLPKNETWQLPLNALSEKITSGSQGVFYSIRTQEKISGN